MKGGIYQLRCLPHGCRYFGSTVDFVRRAAEHRASLLAGARHNFRLRRCLLAHGPDNLVFEILEKMSDPSDLALRQREQEFLDLHFGNEGCLNVNNKADRVSRELCVIGGRIGGPIGGRKVGPINGPKNLGKCRAALTQEILAAGGRASAATLNLTLGRNAGQRLLEYFRQQPNQTLDLNAAASDLGMHNCRAALIALRQAGHEIRRVSLRTFQLVSEVRHA